MTSPQGPAHPATPQLALDLAAPLPRIVAIGSLAPGERFLLEGPHIEGVLVAAGTGSATVSIRGPDDRLTRTTWSLGTVVRRIE